jgi:integrase
MWNKSIDSTRYFGFDNNYLTYYTFRGNIQKVVRQIREIMGYDDSFTFYTARDSWTTIMHSDYQLDPVYTDVGLGHSTKSLAGAHYTNPNVDKLCECHADMLQLLFE